MYRRRGYRKGYRRNYRRNYRRPYKRKTSAWATAYHALRTAQKLKQLINVEYKDHTVDGSAAAVNITNTGNVNHMTGITQGDGVGERDGQSIRLKSWNFRYQLFPNTAQTVTTFVRVILFINKDTVGTPTISGGGDQALLLATQISSPRDLHNTSNLIVLYDKVHKLNRQDTAGPGGSYHVFNKKLNLICKYDGTTSGSGRVNQLYRAVFSDTASNHPTLKYSSRIRYIDN